MEDKIYVVKPCDQTPEQFAEDLCETAYEPTLTAACKTQADVLALLQAPAYINGVRRSYADVLPCPYTLRNPQAAYRDTSPRLIGKPYQRELLAWVIYREIRRRYLGSTTAKAALTSIESALLNGMFQPLREAVSLDPLSVYDTHYQAITPSAEGPGAWYNIEEKIAWHRLGAAAIIYCSLYDRGDGSHTTFLEQMKAGNNAWIEFVIQYAYPQIVPQLLDLDPVYSIPRQFDLEDALRKEMQYWQENLAPLKQDEPGRQALGTVSAPPVPLPPPLWVPNFWPVINSITGGVVTVPGLPPPCAPFPACVTQKVPGMNAAQAWSIVKNFVAKTSGVTLIYDEKGLRFVLPKNVPTMPPVPWKRLVSAAFLQYENTEIPPEEDAGMSTGMKALIGGFLFVGALSVIVPAVAAIGLFAESRKQ